MGKIHLRPVMVEGMNPLEGDFIELWDDQEFISECGIRVYFDLPEFSEGFQWSISYNNTYSYLLLL